MNEFKKKGKKMCIITATAASIAATSIALVSTAVSTTLGVISSNQQAKAAQRQYEYQAQVAQTNQKIAENNAAMERQTGLEEARKQRLKTLQAIGTQQTSLAANGIDIGYGTSLDLIEDTAMNGELDALTIQYNAEKNARNYETQAYNFANESMLSRYAGNNAVSAGRINALSTGIQGLGKMTSTLSSDLGGMGSLGNNSLGKSFGKSS